MCLEYAEIKLKPAAHIDAGAGGYAVVYKAVELKTNRQVRWHSCAVRAAVGRRSSSVALPRFRKVLRWSFRVL